MELKLKKEKEKEQNNSEIDSSNSQHIQSEAALKDVSPT